MGKVTWILVVKTKNPAFLRGFLISKLKPSLFCFTFYFQFAIAVTFQFYCLGFV